MRCLKCNRKLKQNEICYVFTLAKVVADEVYEQIQYKSAICKQCWRGKK